MDSHPMTVDAYCNALSTASFGIYQNTFVKAYNCEVAYNYILEGISSKKIFDIAIIDKRLPKFQDGSTLSGYDIAILLREKMPSCKIIIVTAHTEVVIVYDIVKKIRPEGFFTKNDITPDKLREAAFDISKGYQFQSTMVKKCLEEIFKKEVMIEDFNRQILLYLAKGYRVVELEGVVNLSTSAIQKRIIRMKKAFNITDNSNLVKVAISKGFI